MERPLLVVVTPLIAGIITATALSVPHLPLWFLLSLSLLTLLVARLARKPPLAVGSLTVSFFIVGLLNMGLYTQQVPPDDHISRYVDQGLITVDGIISDDPQVSLDKTDITVSAYKVFSDGSSSAPVSGKVLLGIKPALPLKYGDVVRFRTRLRAPSNFSNPGGFDYERYLRYRGIWVRGFIGQSSHIVVLREGAGHPATLALDAFRRHLKQLIRNHAPTPVAEIIQASILGNQREIPRDVREKFNLTGTSHIIAISGFNMGMVALFVIFATRLTMSAYSPLLLRYDWRRVSAVIAAVFVILYAFIAGAGISVIRATLMILVFMCAILLGKNRQLENTLALAALIILVFAPHFLFDISFQLSFVAVLSLLIITPRLTRWIPDPKAVSVSMKRRLVWKSLRTVLVFLAVTLSAVIGTLPLIVFYFNRLSLVVLLSNLLVVPILGILAIPVCLFIIVAAPLWETAAVFFIKIAAVLVEISLRLIDDLAALPYASITVPTPTLPEMAAYYGIIAVCLGYLDAWQSGPSQQKKRKLIFLSASLTAMLVFGAGNALYWHKKTDHTGELLITAIDVGQGSSTLIRFPEKKIMLIDGGGFYDHAFDIGKYVVAPFLWHERISTIHTVVLTHPHPDHLNGLLYILDHFSVKEIWLTDTPIDSDTYRAFLASARRKHIPMRQISRYTPPIEMDGVRIAFLNPPDQNGRFESFDDENDAAIVMRLTYGKVNILLPADISSAVETSLVNTNKEIAGQVLFIPHHGSRKSSSLEFLTAVKPQTAILSVGKGNLFRLPHQDTLERYRSRKIPVYRTDRHGAITVTTDGNRVHIKTFK